MTHVDMLRQGGVACLAEESCLLDLVPPCVRGDWWNRAVMNKFDLEDYLRVTAHPPVVDHIEKLVAAGPRSGRHLVPLLTCKEPAWVSLDAEGEVVTPYSDADLRTIRDASVGDLAASVLRRIYGVSHGYARDLEDDEFLAAVNRWRKTVGVPPLADLPRGCGGSEEAS